MRHQPSMNTRFLLLGLLLIVVGAGIVYTLVGFGESSLPVETGKGTVIGERGIVSIAVGQSGAVSGVTLTALELLEDSRCPVDVQCIWAGTVRVRAALDAMSRDFVFVLGEPQAVNGKTVTLVAVTPLPTAGVAIEPAEYRFTFAIRDVIDTP